MGCLFTKPRLGSPTSASPPSHPLECRAGCPQVGLFRGMPCYRQRPAPPEGGTPTVGDLNFRASRRLLAPRKPILNIGCRGLHIDALDAPVVWLSCTKPPRPIEEAGKGLFADRYSQGLMVFLHVQSLEDAPHYVKQNSRSSQGPRGVQTKVNGRSSQELVRLPPKCRQPLRLADPP